MKSYFDKPVEDGIEYKYGKRYFPDLSGYCNFNFYPRWNIISELRKKEELIMFDNLIAKGHSFPLIPEEGWDFEKFPICYITTWYVMNILNELETSNSNTLYVKLRIVCGMVNKIPDKKLSKELKIHFMECIWDTFIDAYKDYCEFASRFIWELPF